MMGRQPWVWAGRATVIAAVVGPACIPSGEGPLCPAGLSLCDGRCVDVRQSGDNCGACGARCATGERCRGGACDGCATGLVDCGDGCVSLEVASQHCGACGEVCATTQRCEAGACVDCGTSALCGDRCVDLERDAAHCGACDNTCDEARRCDGGACLAACIDAPLGEPASEVSCGSWEATWVHHAATPGGDDAQAAAFGIDGTIYVAGETNSNLAPFGCETRGASGDDIWVAALRPSGAVAWCERFAGGGAQHVFDLEPLPSGGVALAGRFRNALTHGTTTVCAGNSDEHAFAIELKADGTVGAFFCDARPAASVGQALAVGSDAAYLLGFDAPGSFVGSNNANAVWVLRMPVGGGGEMCNPAGGCSRWSVEGEVTDAGDIIVRDDPAAGEPAVVITTGYERAGDSGSVLPSTLLPMDPTPNLAPGAVLVVGLDADLNQTHVVALGTDVDCLDGMDQQVRNCAIGRALLERAGSILLLLDYRRSFVDGIELPSPAQRDVGVVALRPNDLTIQGAPSRISSPRSDVGVDLVDGDAGFFVVSEVQGEVLVLPDGNEIQKPNDTGLIVVFMDDAFESPEGDAFLLLDGPGSDRGGRATYRQGMLVLPGVTNGSSLRIGDQTLYQVNGDDAFVAAFAY